MSLYGAMRTSTSGMAAQANRLSTVADNIANSNTTGYKRASAEFSSLLLPSGSGQYNSGSVLTHVRYAISEQGGLQATTSVTDLAIKGNGFFVVSDMGGTPYLTRAGSFVPDSAGNLVNAAGYYLMGLPITNGQTPDIAANGYAGLEVVNVSQLALRAEASTAGRLRVNLPSNADAVAPGDLPSAGGSTYTAKTSLISYDNLGNAVVLDVYSTKTGPNTWEVSVFNAADAAAGGGFPYSSGPLTTGNLTFDGTTGQLTSASTVDIPIPDGQTLSLDFAGSSQLAADYTVFESPVNGNAPVGVDSIDISRDGLIYAVYGNGARVPVYKIPLANVPSPDNLSSLAGNVYSVSANSGDVQLGSAGSAGFGAVVSGSLEQSTVDMANELTTMIDAQRGFAANSKVFQSGAELMDVIVNLKR